MFRLSKSQYCSGVQCSKMLWMKKNMPEAFDDDCMNQSVLATGNEVGDLAMGLFGDYVEVPYSKDIPEMLECTNRLMDAAEPVIAEASFAYEGLFCSVDILRNLGENVVEIYEVKSSTGVKEVYLHDVAYQHYVLTKLGYLVRRTCIVHVNNRYVRQGELDLDQLFTIADCSEHAQNAFFEVEETLRDLQRYLEQDGEPADDIGPHCFSPYPCGFWGHCTRTLKRPNVFDISGAHKKKMFEHYYQGLISLEDIYAQGNFGGRQLQQVQHAVCGSGSIVDRQAIGAFLSHLTYPLYFLDFETFNPAIPLFDNTKPYQQIPFQYSLHYVQSEGGPLQHKEFLAQAGTDPRRPLAERLCTDIPRNVCVIAYNMAFEKTQLRLLAAEYPDLSDHLMDIHDNMVDLMVPFKNRAYYTNDMKGAYSIKKVLPALFPDDPQLNYDNLEGVKEGQGASEAFKAMEQLTPSQAAETRQQLLDYCKLDTLAMVKIWQKLQDVVAP